MNASSSATRSCLCFILAKKHSRRLPFKNKRTLHGVPLYEYVFKAATGAGIFSRIVCSSNDEEILTACENHSIIPSVRDESLADSQSSGWEVLRSFLDSDRGAETDICLLTPCHPFRRAEHLQQAYERYLGEDANALLGISKCACPVELAFACDPQGFIHAPWRGLNRKEQHPEAFYTNGTIVFLRRSYFNRVGGNIYESQCLGFPVSWPYSLDIDTEDDLKMAEKLYPLFPENLP